MLNAIAQKVIAINGRMIYAILFKLSLFMVFKLLKSAVFVKYNNSTNPEIPTM